MVSWKSVLVPGILWIALHASAQAQISVLTRNYDNLREGANNAETTLNQATVSSGSFGQLFQMNVDDQVYPGLLYVASLSIAGGVHNVLYVATSNNSVYAFDADKAGAPLWFQNFNGSGRPSTNTEVGGPNSSCGNNYSDIIGDIGITGTPVIDGTTNTMFFVTRTVESGNTVQRLHAISIITGAEQPNSPQVITATVPGTGLGGTSVTFNPSTANQRPALALASGAVYLTWASFCDNPPYSGWALAYDETSLAQVGVFNAVPNGSEAGFWMGGGAPAIDSSGNLYLSDGNGTVDGNSDYGESVLKLSPRTLNVLDYFTPTDYVNLNSLDLDIGSSGPNFIPGTNLFAQGSKQGIVFILDSGNLGHLNAATVNPTSFQAVNVTSLPNATHHIHNTNISWISPEGTNLYVWGENDYLRAYRFNGSTAFNFPAFAIGSILPPLGMPGGMMTLSANGSVPGSGVLWASVPLSGDASHATVPGVLYAFNAETLQLLWSSSKPQDNPGNFAKYNPPIVANGKLYLASFSNLVSVYGLPQQPSLNPVIAISAGGPPAGYFSGDEDVVGGTPSSSSNYVDTSAVAYPAPESVYDYERDGNFIYTLPGLAAGATYTVRLHFAETFYANQAQRIFNVTINGLPALVNFDIVAAAGSSNKAIIENFAATANASGQIVVQFFSVIGQAKVNALEVVAGTALLADTAIKAGGVGSGIFVADEYYTGGTPSVPVTTPINVANVVNPAPQSVYQAERYGNFQYNIPGLVSGSPYTVRLHFAETYWAQPGQRLFNVIINGQQLLTNFDIVAAAGGPNTAVIAVFPVNANTNGQIVIQFVTVVNNAKVNAIEVTPGTTTQIFADVPPTEYYESAVNLLWSKAITAGCAMVDYCPGESVTRAEMAIFIVRGIIGSDNFQYTQIPYFTDVPPGSFGFAWIQKLRDLGITSGCAPTLFCPTEDVPRDQMAVFIIRARYGAVTAVDYPATPYFTDVSPGDFAYNYIQRLREDNITSGCSPTMFCPSEPVTRGDMAIFLMRGLYNLLLPPTQPIITGVYPPVLYNNTTTTIALTAFNTNFVQGVTVVNSVNGLTAGPVTVLGPNALTVPVTIPPGFSQPISLWVTTGAEEAVFPNGLQVQ